jgi:MEDS: MEthanogen/methylotroph, DcmR Sensory domain
MKMTSDRPIHFAGGTLGAQRHICAFFNGIDEEHRVLRSFIKEGLDGGEKELHIIESGLRGEHLRRLAEAGIDVERAIATGQLELRSWQDSYLRGERFDQDAMLALVVDVIQSSAEAGYPSARLLGHMEWALLDRPGVEDLLEYETRVNYLLYPYANPVVCAYDLSRFGAQVAMDAMRTHPMVIIGGILQENPFFVPPDQFLLEIRERRATRKNTGMAG